MNIRVLCLTLPFASTQLLGCPSDDGEPVDTGADTLDTGNDDTSGNDDDASSSDDGGSSDTAEPTTCPAPTQGPTHHDDDIVGHEVWTADASPHIVDWTVDVRDGATLEIEPCAVVQFAAGHGMNVAFPGTPTTGTLIAEGTAEQPIRFEGIDGGNWGHLRVQSPGTARLSYVTFADGGDSHTRGVSLEIVGENTWPVQSAVFVDHVTIERSLGAGVEVGWLAKFMEGSTDLVVRDSGSELDPYPMIVDEHALDSLPTGSYTGNRIDEIRVEPRQSVHEDTLVRDLGVPYFVGTGVDLVVGSGDQDAPATMTIEPGVTLEFAAGSAFEIEHYTGEFAASGILVAHGTEADPIVFTSGSDDPQPGDWIGLWFGGMVQPETRLSHVRIEYTGADCGCILLTCSDIDQFEGAVIIPQPVEDAFITDSVIANGSSHGFVLGFDGDDVDFRSENTFEGMAGCPSTLPRAPSCPDPRPSCME